MADYLPPVVIEIEGREDKLVQALTRAKEQVRRFTADVGRMNADIGVTLDDASVRRVEAALAHLTRDRTVRILADADTRVAADDLDLLARARQVRVTADADTRVAADDLALLTRPRTVTIHTRTTGANPTHNRIPSGGGGGEGGGGGALGTLLSLAPALAPIAAEAVAVAGAVASATVAVGAFGAAVKPQLAMMSGLSDAQAKVNEAVAKYGPGSKQASAAAQEFSRTMAAMPAQTRQAAGALLILKSDFSSWSNSLAKFTMKPVTQGIEILDAILPKLSPLVKGASTQFTRLTTLLAGGVNSGAFDGLISRFTTFTNGVLKSATDGVVHFVRVLSQGGGNGALSQFMAYAKANAPLVKETLANLAQAVMKVLQAASQAGPGMLTLVNAFAKLVAAMPTSLVTRLLQIYAAFKLLKLGTSGIGTVAEGIESLVKKFRELRTVSTAAGGGLTGLRAAFLSLGTAAKASIVVGALALLAVGIKKLSDMGKTAPPDVDKLTTALKNLAATGKFTGELKKSFGDVHGLVDDIKRLNELSSKVKNPDVSGFRTPNVSGYARDFDSLKNAFKSADAAMAGLVSSGHADAAAKSFDTIRKAAIAQGIPLSQLNALLPKYKSALADQAVEQELTAQSMGLFGEQALRVQAALDKQKAAAEGLQQAILDLNDTNRSALDAESAYQQAIDDATAAIKGHRHALHMANGQLDLNSKAAREAYAPLSQLAATAEESAKATLKQTGSQDKANRVLIDAHAQLVRVARQMGLSATDANALADKLDNIKDPKIQVTVAAMKAESDLRAFNAAVKASPGAKSVTLTTLSKQAEQVLEAFGFKVTHLKNGKVTISAGGSALTTIANVASALRALNGKTATTYLITEHRTIYTGNGGRGPNAGGAQGGLVATLPKRANGGPVQGYPEGGYIQGPGSPTSDSITALLPSGPVRVSDSEYVVQASAVRKYGVALLDALNRGHLRLAAFARGGKVTKSEREARNAARGELTLSHFGRMAGYHADETVSAFGAPSGLGALVNALNQMRSVIEKSTHGKTESSLLKQLDKAGKSLISYDKQLTKVTASLASAKTKLDDLKNSAAQLKSSVSSSILQGNSVVTQAPQAGFALTTQDVLNNLSAQLSSTLTFSNNLQALKKKGLSADLLEQIASAGVEQGGATAAALMGASASQIKQLNSMQSQMKKSADAAGSAVADSMYGAGIKAAEGLVKGLEKQKKHIEKAMLDIAKSMEKAIKKALGIKSPSTVMAQVGDYTALGLAQGIQRSSKHAVIAARGMAMSVYPGAALTGSSRLTTVSAARAGGGTVHHHHYEFHIEGNAVTMDRLAKDVEQAFLRRGMRNPATYPAYKR